MTVRFWFCRCRLRLRCRAPLSLLFPFPGFTKGKPMKYDEDLMVELIAIGELTHTKISEQLDVSRRTVWRIANGLSRPDLQLKISDTVEGIRQATVRFAARRMDKLLEKEMEVALGDGETARKSREFMIKTFMVTIPAQADKVASQPPPPRPADTEEKLDGMTLYNNLFDLSPELKKQVVEELCGPAEAPEPPCKKPEKPKKEPEPEPDKKTTEKENQDANKNKKRVVVPPFSDLVKGPDGTYIHKISLVLAREARQAADEHEEKERQRNMRRRTPKPM
jgi:hypothetical protein